MKKAFISIVVLAMALCATATAQNSEKTYKREGKTFVQSDTQVLPNDVITDYVWRDKDGAEYPIILHTYTKGEKAGTTTAYVIRVSKKSGKPYRYFLKDGAQIAQEIISESK